MSNAIDQLFLIPDGIQTQQDTLMGTILQTCESCRISLVNNVVDHETDYSYQLCAPCRKRLHDRALRPLEFFNLVAIHGHTHDLHDDFYDYNTGEATQPSAAVENAHDFPFPTLQVVRDDLHKLVDFACVEYFTADKTIELILTFDKEKILEYLRYKVIYNRGINYKCYEIASKTLHLHAGKWIREEWNNREPGELAIFAEALAMCLPAEEAFNIITAELQQFQGNMFAQQSLALCYLRSSNTLDWIENNHSKIINVSSGWGVIVAASQFNWHTAEKWLSIGRPLSLIALDALDYCTNTNINAPQNWPFWVIVNRPSLAHSLDAATIANCITEYLKKDKAPRIRASVQQIIENLFNAGQAQWGAKV